MPFIDWKCPKCGREIRVDGSLESCYCNACGKKITIATSMAADYAVPAEGLVDWKCPKCGREIRVDASLQICYCNVCGKKIPVVSKSMNNASDKPASGWKSGTASSQSDDSPEERAYRAAIDKGRAAFYAYEYEIAAAAFESLGDYKDSARRAENLRRRSSGAPSSVSAARRMATKQKSTSSSKVTTGWRSGTAADPSIQSSASANLSSTEDAKKNPWIGGTCPYCDKDVYALEEKRIPCPYCGKPIDAKTITQRQQGWKSGTSAGQPASKRKQGGSSGQSGKDSTGNISRQPVSQSKMPFLDNWKTSVGMFILGLVCSYGFGSLGVFGTPVLLGVAVTFAIGLLYWTLSGYPSLFTSNPHLRSRGAVSFFNAFFGGIIFGALWNTCLTKGKKGVSQNVFLALIIVMCVFIGAFMFPNLSGVRLPDFNSGSAKSSAAQPANNTNNSAKSNTSTPAQPNTTTKRSYEDERWPTFKKDTLAIPESERWYNAADSLGTWCRITGPVNRVYEGQDTSGNQVTIIEIGTSSYSSSSKPVSLIIWPWDAGNLGDVIDGCRKKSTWLTVEGSLYEDNGRYVFASSNGVTCTYWTNINWP